ncbi:MAG TPA: 30S ribosomal protein S6 [Syntrophales bacterium]|nr:30S ribosomal protein S6 [Syntrophales bacterium]
MKRYETLFIVQVDLPDDELNSLIERYETIVTSFKGVIVKIEKWGKRKLAYEIKKQTNGFYVMIDFVGKRAVIEELERNFKIDDKILKFMTIMKDDKPDLVKIEKEKQDELRIEAPHNAPATESQSPADKTEVDEDKHSTSS